MFLLLACATAPGQNEDEWGVPRRDLAGCTSTQVDDSGSVQDVYDDRGHLVQRTLAGTGDPVVIPYVRTLDEQDRPVRVEQELDGGSVSWSETWYDGDTWKIAGESRGRDDDTYSTTSWTWGNDSVEVTDDASDCWAELDVDGIRMTAADTFCPELVRAETRAWKDDRVASVTVDQPEFETTSVLTLTWSDGLLASGELQVDGQPQSSYEVTWDCP